MPITDSYDRVLCSQILIPPDRQRKDISTSDIDDSIRDRGVLNPIIVKRDLTLVAGERRLRSSMAVGHETIPIRYLDDLSEIEVQTIELEENIKRKALDWREEVAATANLHRLYVEANAVWSQDKTAAAIGVTQGHIAKTLRVAQSLDSPKIATAVSINQAHNTLTRGDERSMADKLSKVVEAGVNLFKPKPQAAEPAVAGAPVAAAKPSAPAFPESIHNLSFLEWAPTYKGSPFTFIHCDFPYGVNLFAGPWSGKNSWQGYADTEEIYWKLIRCLCENLDRLMAPSAHLMFWFSMQHYEETLEMFGDLAPSLEFSPFPLIWHKTDNAGIVPDAKRWPRRVYETALIASRGDRPLVKPVANAYGAPTDRANRAHPSAKPEPVLNHFFQMFCDETTRLLDPTCGAGSALRAAENYKAEQVVGLEIDAEYAKSAADLLKQSRLLRSAKL